MPVSTPCETPLSRRTLIRNLAAVGGGMILGFHVPVAVLAVPAPESATPGSPLPVHEGAEINAWLAIDTDGGSALRAVAAGLVGRHGRTRRPAHAPGRRERDLLRDRQASPLDADREAGPALGLRPQAATPIVSEPVYPAATLPVSAAVICAICAALLSLKTLSLAMVTLFRLLTLLL